MAYEKQTWTTGEVITAEKLNHMEDGIADAGGDVVVVHASISQNNGVYTVNSVSHTYDEIMALVDEGKTVCANCGIASGYGTMYYVLWYSSNAYEQALFGGVFALSGSKWASLTIPKNGDPAFEVAN